MKYLATILVFSFLLTTTILGGDMLTAGQTAPDFALKDAQGKTHKLSDYKGKLVVLYFYPKDDTPGCTAEACNIRDNYDDLLKRNIVILGISFDDRESHQKFSEKYKLPFPILSDNDKKVAKQYGAMRGALLSFVGPKRITYLIDEQQKILHVFEKVDTKNHSAQILKLLNSMKK